ncbi:MAG: acid phosphatase AphA [Candidatus Rifleibacteriota bacterium]
MFMRKFAVLMAVLLLFTCSAYARGDFYYNTISLEEIGNSLPSRPIAVGFDVDDTVLFSSPGFYYGFENTDGPGGTNKYGPRPLSNDKFWEDMNNQFDKFSIPKPTAVKVIEMHKRRGDKIYFITARPATKSEILTPLLKKAFKLPENSPKVIFAGKTSKGVFIKKHKIALFYGDADTDISEANEVGIRAIRFMRSPTSTNKSKYHPGMYGEAVLENSAD